MRLVLVPPVPALLPEYASLTDPVADLRRACVSAVRWLHADAPTQVVVVGGADDPVAPRVAAALLTSTGFSGSGDPSTPGDVECAEAVLVLANGSARRGERAPGHFDERSFDFDHEVGSALKTGDLAALEALDPALADDLLAVGLGELGACVAGLRTWQTREVLFDDDPYGVQYWVVTALCES
ncbi:MAG: hypothetical protein L0H93_01725 [Nocardioides sp.]|nr:hypothetical protein [Nocardioides sp.]